MKMSMLSQNVGIDSITSTTQPRWRGTGRVGQLSSPWALALRLTELSMHLPSRRNADSWSCLLNIYTKA